MLSALLFVISISGILSNKDLNAVAAGEKIYKQQCFACHGDNGKGQGAKEGTAINNQHYLNTVSDKDIYQTVKYGRDETVMPAYGSNLSEKDLGNLTAYIRNWQTNPLI